jgi:hypothetical protein
MGLTLRGSTTQPLRAIETISTMVHASNRKYVKKGRLIPFVLLASKSCQDRYLFYVGEQPYQRETTWYVNKRQANIIYFSSSVILTARHWHVAMHRLLPIRHLHGSQPSDHRDREFPTDAHLHISCVFSLERIESHEFV